MSSDPSNINFAEFRRIVCISQDMLQGATQNYSHLIPIGPSQPVTDPARAAEKDGLVQTLADAGGNREAFIDVLDDHRVECENEGDYEEVLSPHLFISHPQILCTPLHVRVLTPSVSRPRPRTCVSVSCAGTTIPVRGMSCLTGAYTAATLQSKQQKASRSSRACERMLECREQSAGY